MKNALLGLLAIAGMQQVPVSINGLTPEQADILQHMSIVDLPDGTGDMVRTLRVEGVNLQIVNGTGFSLTENGTGNLIVGYAETVASPSIRTGSHNIVFGIRNSWTSHCAVVGGENNVSIAPHASVLGGEECVSEGIRGVILGGRRSVVSATAPYGMVLGGFQNHCNGSLGVAVGGSGNEVGPLASTGVMLGGFDDTCSGQYDIVGGSIPAAIFADE